MALLALATACTRQRSGRGDDDDESGGGEAEGEGQGEGEGEGEGQGEGEGEGEGEPCNPQTCSGTWEECCPLEDGRTVCKNTSSSFTDCGSCGDVGAPCEGSLESRCCADEGGTASCHDVRSDPLHCGECGRACEPLIANICRLAACVCGVPEDIAVNPMPCENLDDPDDDTLDACCPGLDTAEAPNCSDDPTCNKCVDLDVDVDNCGRCGRACDQGEECVDGECLSDN